MAAQFGADFELQKQLIQSLTRPECYDHEVENISIIETHISWVILTGDYAYKIKKSLNLGFLDYSSLALRRHYCQQELIINRRTAEQIYLDCVPVYGTPAEPSFSPFGPIIEYAVKMQQFPQQALLSHMAEQGHLDHNLIEQLANTLAGFHQAIEQLAADSPLGEPDVILQPVEENFSQILERFDNSELQAILHPLKTWALDQYQRNQIKLKQRKSDGFVRQCHGDLHLGNIAYIDNRIVLFDAIEFNPRLSWIDVISELAFLTMDLEARGHSNFSARLLNQYLQQTGDYSGLALLRFYQLYRAMVRAKVTAISLSQSPEHTELNNQFQDYLQLANSYTRPVRLFLIISHGLSGSGKTHFSKQLAAELQLIHLSSDIERKRLFGLAADQDSQQTIHQDIYTQQATIDTYQRLYDLTRQILTQGFPVVVDATFLRHRQRHTFQVLAQDLAIPFVIMDLTDDPKLFKQRIQLRQQQGHDPSEADISIMERQQVQREPLASEERHFALSLDSGHDPGWSDFKQRLLQLLK